MKILKRYFTPGGNWEPITLDEFRMFMEARDSGHSYEEAKCLIENEDTVTTQFAEYKLARRKDGDRPLSKQ